MPADAIQTIPLHNLLLDVSNPRYPPNSNQRDALAAIIADQGEKLINIAEDMVENDLNPSDLPMVTRTDDPNLFIVVEGNRRIAALKFAISPEILDTMGVPKKIVQRFKTLSETPENIPQEIVCAVVTREDANDWIYLKHTGENDGIGIVRWDGLQAQRFRGSSPALQAIELVAKSKYLTDDVRNRLQRIAITNIERILATPDARAILGVGVQNKQLIVDDNDEAAIARLAMIVSDIALRVKKVTDLDNKDQRIRYANEIVARPLPQATNGDQTNSSGTASSTATASKPQATSKAKPINAARNTLIPKRFKIAIPQERINRIYVELQRLDLTKYTNSCAVTLRVFVELSIDHYAHEKQISLLKQRKPSGGTTANPPAPLPPQDMRLREKIDAVVDYMEIHQVCNLDDLQGIKAITRQKDHIMSIESWNAYVHNRNYDPAPADLIANWNSIQEFVRVLWT